MTILLVDLYDSFTYNLQRLVETASGDEVVVVHNDSIAPERLDRVLDGVDAVVVGPGPGHPANPGDVGVLPLLFGRSLPVPVLGICLGFQSMCLEAGCRVEQTEPRHGQVYAIHPWDPTPPADPVMLTMWNSPLSCVRYHSLEVLLEGDNVVPLAYAQDGDRRVLMAGRHASKPFWGVQYHPESICSEKGHELVLNFMGAAREWNQTHRSVRATSLPPPDVPHQLNHQERATVTPAPQVHAFSSPHSPIDVCSHWLATTPAVLLNLAAAPGEWSIMGEIIDGESPVISHSTQGNGTVSTGKWGVPEATEESALVWDVMARFMDERIIQYSNPHGLPFVGGLVGVVSYEEGQYVDTQAPSPTSTPIPDTRLVFVERAVVHKTGTNQYFAVSIRPNDNAWVELVEARVGGLTPEAPAPNSVAELCSTPPKITLPLFLSYSSAYTACQEHLHAGNLYELCLTTDATIELPTSVSPWDVYRVLAHRNPLPYLCFLQFGDCFLVLLLPERFLSWSSGGKVQLRPIKGTVRKGPGMTTVEEATAVLHTPKELGENLMIVDLIRHDLHSMMPDVRVSQLMAVEEYKTVFQLVSVIEGQLPATGARGIDVLASSLPPGSMTGAPKKRSVEILAQLEKRRRGLYSGVCGYWSVTDDADWSVVIRLVFGYADDQGNSKESQVFRIGAGGAVTVLSTLEGEWEEMEIKLASAMQAFQ